MKRPYFSPSRQGVSIITCTKRPSCMNTLFHNYGRQRYRNKELIVILNNDSMKMSDYITAAKSYKNVRIYRLPARISLGACLNYGVKRSRYNYIAKFDDDDYYAPNYLADSMRSMRQTNADIVGKRAHYMYLQGKKWLLLRFPGLENKYVSFVQGATLLVKRKVFRKVAFPNKNQGECIGFCFSSRTKGLKIFSGRRHNFFAFRRKNARNHTWIISDNALLSRNVKVLKVGNVKKFVSRR